MIVGRFFIELWSRIIAVQSKTLRPSIGSRNKISRTRYYSGAGVFISSPGIVFSFVNNGHKKLAIFKANFFSLLLPQEKPTTHTHTCTLCVFQPTPSFPRNLSRGFRFSDNCNIFTPTLRAPLPLESSLRASRVETKGATIDWRKQAAREHYLPKEECRGFLEIKEQNRVLWLQQIRHPVPIIARLLSHPTVYIYTLCLVFYVLLSVCLATFSIKAKISLCV